VQRSKDAEKGLPSGISLLIAEDDDNVREFAASVFENAGWTVYAARHGREALRLLAAHPEIALLFTDIRMPVMEGPELVEEALLQAPDLKIVLTTGYYSKGHPLAARYPLVKKPYRFADLAAVFRTVLRAD
jgi:CheY-like chemotaxis protein